MDEVDIKTDVAASVVADNSIDLAAQMNLGQGDTSPSLSTNLGGVLTTEEDGLGLEHEDMITNSDPGSEETVIIDAADIKLEPEDLGSLQGDTSPSKFGHLGGSVPKRGPGRPRKDGRLSPKPWKKQQNRARSNPRKSNRTATTAMGSPFEEGAVAGPEAVAAGVECAVPQVLAHLKQETPLVLAHLKQDPAQLAGRTPDSMDMAGDESGDSCNIHLPPPMERTISEESFNSECSLALGTLCSLCSRGEKSLLGQGDLMCYTATPGFNPFKKQLSKLRRSSSEIDELKSGEKSPKHLTWRRPRGPAKSNSVEFRERIGCKSPRRTNPHSLQDEEARAIATADELSLVGLSEDTDISQVFDKTGQCWTHFCCAAWSEGVIQAEDLSLQFVDKAVFSGHSQKCLYCRRYGATIVCRYPKCNKKYHYPCASGSGCFQEIKTLSLLCPEHADQAESFAGSEASCVVCDTPGQIAEQLFCTSCGQHYHGNCLDPPVEVNPVVRAGWQCPECKICQTCRQPGDDNKMLVCDTCDKGYHTFCLKPVMTTIPKNGWKCKNCRVCGDCGSRTPGSGPSSRWHLNYSVCDSCYQQRNKGLSCPLCGKAYRQFTQKQMVQCNLCKKHVHAECDGSIDMEIVKQSKSPNLDYMCPVCKNRESSDIDIGNFPDALGAMIDDSSLQDIENFEIFKSLKGEPSGATPVRGDSIEGEELMHSSQESLILTEESISSVDIDINALEKGANQMLTSSNSGLPGVSGPITTASNMALSASGLSGDGPTRPPGPGMGKPSFGKKFGKKMGAGRPRGRTMGGKKKNINRGPCERKRGPKPKKQGGGTGYNYEAKNNDDDPSSTTVICSSKDKFTLQQDMCYSCGSLGKGEEGKLIVCTQCGQCYHPYCASVKVSTVVLQKGWRCLDCTVCEGCGKPHDEGRLILCDECDISYHIYCLDPPLDHVPKGTWKCKWCVICVTCGSTTPGTGCQWQNNYSQCGPCSSHEYCQICYRNYKEEDLVIECNHCDRWFHAGCDGLRNEDDAERAAEFGYNCVYCRAVTGAQGPLPPPPPSPEPMTPSPPPSPPPVPTPISLPPKPMKTFFLDGVLLSENGLNAIKTQSMKVMEKRKTRRRNRLSDHLNRGPGLQRLMSEEDMDADRHASAELMEAEDQKSDLMGEDGELLSPPLDKPGDPTTPIEKQKRKRMRFGTGVGGFMVRARGRGGTLMSRRLGPKAHGSLPLNIGLDGDDKLDGEEPGVSGDGMKKIKRRRPRIKPKSQLEDSFPVYLQDAFFGRPLMDKSKEPDVNTSQDFMSDIEEKTNDSAIHSSSTLEAKDPFEFPESPDKKIAQHHTTSGVLKSQQGTIPPASLTGDASDLNHDSDKEQLGDDDLSSFLPVAPEMADEDIMQLLTGEKMTDTMVHENEAPSQAQTEHKEAAMHFPINSDINDLLGTVGSDMEHLDSKTVEDLFKDVTGLPLLPQQPGTGDPLAPQSLPGSGTPTGEGSFPLPPLPSPTLGSQHPGSGVSTPTTNPQSVGSLLTRHASGMSGDDTPTKGGSTPNSSMSPFSISAQSPNMQTEPFSGLGFPTDAGLNFHQPPAGPSGIPSMSMSGLGSQPASHNVPASQGSMEEPEPETLSYNKRNIQKWEKDEPLGELATISPVLYANLQFPELKQQYPDWSERSKQIAKLWRKCPADQKPPFLAKARENRANSRLQKAQKVTDAVKKRNTAKNKTSTPLVETSPVIPEIPAPPVATPPKIEPGTGLSCEQFAVPESPGSSHSSPTTVTFGQPRPPRPAISEDPYAHQPGTPHPNISRNYAPFAPGQGLPSRPMEISTPHANVFKQPAPPPPPMPGPRPHDPYAMPPGTPRPGPEHPASRQSPNMPDPYGQQPATPRPPAVDSFSRGDPFSPIVSRLAGGSTPTSEDGGDPYSRPPGTPRQMAAEDPYAAGPATPGTPGEQYSRPGQGAPFPGPGTRLPGPYMGMNRPDHFSPPNSGPPTPSAEGIPRPPGPPRSMPADPFGMQPGTPHPLAGQHQEEDPNVQQQMMPGGHQFMPDPQGQQAMQPMFRRPSPYGINRAWPYPLSQYYADDKGKNPGQVKELLAKHTKKRVNQKKQQLEEQREHGQVPLRHWPEEGMQYPAGAGPTYPGDMPPSAQGPRPPPPSYPGPQMRPHGRWPEDQLRQAQPGIRPEGENFLPRGAHGELGMRGPGPYMARQVRPGFPVPGQNPGMNPYQPQFPHGQRMPGQFMEMRHQESSMSPAERQRIPYLQMFQERLRQQQQQQAAQGGQMGGQRQQTSPIASPQPGQTSPRFPNPHMAPQMPIPGGPNPAQHGMARMPGNPLDPYDHMVRPGHPGGSHPPGVRGPPPAQMRPGGPRMAVGPQGPFPPGIRPPGPVEASQMGQTVSAGEALSSLASNAMANADVAAAQPGFTSGSEQSPKTVEKTQSPLAGPPPAPTGQPPVAATAVSTAAPAPHPTKEHGEGHENLDDLLAADGSFNLLEYADPDLDPLLPDELDKSMFDEHLGIKKEDESDDQLPTQTRPGPAPSGPGAPRAATSRPVEQRKSAPARTSTPQAAPVPAATVALPTPAASQDEKTSESRSPLSAETQKPAAGSTPGAQGGDVSKSSPQSADFQGKFVEFSQRKASDMSADVTAPAEKPPAQPAPVNKPVTRSKSPKGAGNTTPKQSEATTPKPDTIPQIDGCHDLSPIPQLDGAFDLTSSSECDSDCEDCVECREVRHYCFSPIPMQVDGPNDDGETKETSDNSDSAVASEAAGVSEAQPSETPAAPAPVQEAPPATPAAAAPTTVSTAHVSNTAPVAAPVAAPVKSTVSSVPPSPTVQKSPVAKMAAAVGSLPVQSPVAALQHHVATSVAVSNPHMASVGHPQSVAQLVQGLHPENPAASAHPHPMAQQQTMIVSQGPGGQIQIQPQMSMAPGHPYGGHQGPRHPMGVIHRPVGPPQMGPDVRSPLGPPPPYPGGQPPVHNHTGAMQMAVNQQPVLGQSPHQSPRPGQSPHPVQSPHAGQSPHQIHSPHPGQSPHTHQHPHPGSSPRPGVSPHPVQSPHGKPMQMPGTPQPLSQPMPSPRSAGQSPHPGASPHHSVTSPHPLSRSGTPQMASPRTPVGSQPTTPQGAPPPGFGIQPGTPQGAQVMQGGGSGPGTPTAGPPVGLLPGQPAAPAQIGQPGVSQAPQMMAVSSGMQPMQHPASSLALSQQQYMQQQQQMMYSMQQGQMPPHSTMMTSMGQPGQPVQRFPHGIRPGMPPQNMPPGHPYPPAQTTLTTTPGTSHSTIGALLNQQRPMGHPQVIEAGGRPPGPMGQPQYQGQVPGPQGGPPGQRMPFQMPPHQRPPHQFPHGMPQGARPGMPPQGQGYPGMPRQPGQFQGMPPQSQAQMAGQGMQGHPNMAGQRMMFAQRPPMAGPPGQRMMAIPPHEGAPGPQNMQGMPQQRMPQPQQGQRMPFTLQQQRTLLLQEQPLLLEDLLEQEKLEQRRQVEQQNLLQNQPGGQPTKQPPQPQQPSQQQPQQSQAQGTTQGLNNTILTDADYEKLGVDVMGDGVSQPGQQGKTGAAAQPAGQPPTGEQQPPTPATSSGVGALPANTAVGVPTSVPVGSVHLQHPGPHPHGMGQPPHRFPHPDGQWKDAMSPNTMMFPRGPTPQVSPRTPSPFTAPSPGANKMPSHSPAMQSPTMPIPPPPPRPPAPPHKAPGEPITPDERAAHQQYDEWVMQNANFLGMQVRNMETAVGKHRKTKKSLGAKQRQAKKQGGDLTEEDAKTLEIASGEQSRLQKQLEALRKQQRAHTQLLQDYKAKQQERFGQAWGSPHFMPGMPPGMHGPPGPGMKPPGPGPNMQVPNVPGAAPPQPRMPGNNHNQPLRLPAAARQEYEAYVQGRLRMLQPGPAGRGTQLVSGIGEELEQLKMSLHQLLEKQNQPNITVVGPHAPTMVDVKDENNPFSESYQQREYTQRFQQQEQQRIQMQRHVEQQRVMSHVEPDGTERQQIIYPGQDGPQRFQFPPEGAGPRYPGPRGFPMDGPRMMGPRMPPGMEGMRQPMPGDPTRPPGPGVMGEMTSPDGQMKMRFPQPSPNPSMYQQGQGHMGGFSSPPQTPQSGDVFGLGGTPGGGSTPGTPTASTPISLPTPPSALSATTDTTAASIEPPAKVKRRKKRPKKGQKEALAEPDMSSINISMPYMPPIPGEAPLGPPAMVQAHGLGPQQMMGPRAAMYPGPQGMPHPMGPRPLHMPPGMQPGVPMSQQSPLDKKDMPSGMTELQKLVNMQPQMSQPELTIRQAVSGAPMSSMGMTMTSAGTVVMATSAGMMSRPGEVRIPATQPVPPQLCTAVDGKPDGERPDGLAMMEAEMHRPLQPGDDGKSNQNVLLKQLLNMRKQQHNDPSAALALQQPIRRMSEVSMPEEDQVNLTAEQERQLQMIESMPLTMETEISNEEWEKKTPEEKEKIIGSELRRQEFEARRRELADAAGQKKPQQRQRKKRKDVDGKEPVKKRKKKDQAAAAAAAGLTGLPGVTTPTKADEVDHAAITEQIMAVLRTLPVLTLQEPEVHINHSICPITGTPSLHNVGDNQLQGLFGKSVLDGVPDFYNNFPFGSAPTTPSVRELLQTGQLSEDAVQRMTSDIAARRRLIGDALGSEQERFNIMPRLHEGIPTPESLIGLIGQRQAGGVQDRINMPSPPLIEPREIPSRASDASPATIIYSSSPECTAEENIKGPSFQGLKLISMNEGKSEDEKERECSSPAVPVICPVPVKATEVNGELPPEIVPPVVRGKIKTKEILGETAPPLQPEGEGLRNKMSALTSALGRPLKDATQNNQLSVTLNINHNQSEDFGGVISAIADLLKIAVPPPPEISRSPSPSPDPQKLPLGTIKGAATHKEEAINIQHLIKSKPRFCRHCDSVVLNAGIKKKKSDLPYLKKTDHDMSFLEEEDITFCSMNCYMQFDIAHRHASEPAPIPAPKPEAAMVEVKQESRDDGDGKERVKPLIIRVPPEAQIPVTSHTPRKQKDKRRRSSSASVQEPARPLVKKWRGQKYKMWEPNMLKNEKLIHPATPNEITALMKRLGTTIKPTKWKDDRICVLCQEAGDAEADGPGRLLNMDANKWVHLNCALWSYEVYETMNGALVHVDQAVKRGSSLECIHCGQKGATVGCFKQRCNNIYHVRCAKMAGMMFFQDKTVLCSYHIPKQPESVLECISVYRKVYINRDENRQVATVIHQDEKKFVVRVGSLVIHNIGQLLPHQIQTGKFHNRDYIYPVGFKSTRFYWSYRQMNKRCRFICKIEDSNGQPDFIVTMIEEGFDKITLKDPSCRGVWNRILEPLEKLRRENDLVKMFPPYIPGEELFGLTDPTVLKVAESLPGIELLTNYNWKYGRSPLYELPLAINPTGCARTEQKLRTNFKRPHTLHSSSNSRCLPSTVTVVPGDVNSPYMKQFVHSKSQQYRRLKTEWRNNVYLRRSNIQGLGLFATRDLEKHTMVIEYIGELIRNEVAETREKYYDQQNRGVYMFRIDDNIVVDATMAGGPARYINHSCNPNCVAEVVPFERDSKIIIIAKRRIARGEELTYDYKFDFEDDQHKIPCGCGAANCRKWMN